MRIAILGTRGIPARYGGFETFAEQLAVRLAARGNEVTVYCRSHYAAAEHADEYRGVRLKTLPTLRHKYGDTVAHTFLCALHSFSQSFDVVLVCNAANAPFIPLLRMAGARVAINVDGLEHKRRKWGRVGKAYYRLTEWLAVKLSHETVTDACAIQDYYLTRHRAKTTMIAYGADVERQTAPHLLNDWQVAPDEYILYVSRLEPENNAHLVIEAFRQLETDKKLLIVGGAPYAHDYIRHLHQLADGDARIIFTGFVFGTGYKTLQQNAYCYVQATEVGGTHPALLEAMGYGNCVLTLDTPENLEVLHDAGLSYRTADELAKQLRRVLDDKILVQVLRARAQNRIRQYYTWEQVVDAYEQMFARLLTRNAPAFTYTDNPLPSVVRKPFKS